MNANELADELCFAEMDSDEIETWAKEARNMLRQQQAEIEDLKLQNKYLKGCKPNIEIVAENEILKKKIISLEFLARKEK